MVKKWAVSMDGMFGTKILFLSHRSTDKIIIEQIALELKNYGMEIWFDKEKLVRSDFLTKQIYRGLEQMTHFVLFWSKGCKESPWIEMEKEAAKVKQKEKGVPIFIIQLDNIQIPSDLENIIYINAKDMTPKEIGTKIVDFI